MDFQSVSIFCDRDSASWHKNEGVRRGGHMSVEIQVGQKVSFCLGTSRVRVIVPCH